MATPKKSKRTARILDLLRRYESRNVTYLEPGGAWPILWEKARGNYVWDAAGRRYLDLTAAFGVAAAGHANPRVVRAARQQAGSLLHAMGDVHPHELKARLAEKLSEITFERWTAKSRRAARKNTRAEPAHGKAIFCNSGFEAVEAALKTAALATGRSNVLAFEGAYHGLGYGTLNVTHREHFRSPFVSQLREFGAFVPFPRDENELDAALDQVETGLRKKSIGAVLVEPVQARAGIVVPPMRFLPGLRKLCDEHGALLILDEIYTGFGRTGRWFACEHSATVPDLICLGKALTGGFPLSVCIGKADLMDRAWPPSTGEAMHTSTFLGHPVGCAMALAQIGEIAKRRLVERSRKLGGFFQSKLNELTLRSPGIQLRGCGLMQGLEIVGERRQPETKLTFSLIKRMLEGGYILLPEGEHGNVIGFTPPLTITRKQLLKTVDALGNLLIKAQITNCAP